MPFRHAVDVPDIVFGRREPGIVDNHAESVGGEFRGEIRDVAAIGSAEDEEPPFVQGQIIDEAERDLQAVQRRQKSHRVILGGNAKKNARRIELRDTALFKRPSQLGGALKQRGITQLNPACVFLGVSTEYHSMGFLSALDGLQVTFSLVNDLALNKRRLFVFGTSYGGYIANLAAKFAPNTFRMVIDNSGFSSAEDDIWNVYGMSKWHSPEGVAMSSYMVSAFSEDPSAANYFAPAHKKIRSLLNREHVFEGSARH